MPQASSLTLFTQGFRQAIRTLAFHPGFSVPERVPARQAKRANGLPASFIMHTIAQFKSTAPKRRETDCQPADAAAFAFIGITARAPFSPGWLSGSVYSHLWT